MIISMRFDMRACPGGPEHSELYPAAVELCERAEHVADNLFIVLSEHHGSPDGYLPSPLIMAAALAGRTRNAHILVVALVLPLHDPLHIAEDIAVLDLVSGGRVDVVLGAGYRHEEFEMFGADIRRRGATMEAGVRALEAAWSGKPFEFDGRTVQVTPRPLRRPRPPIILGGSSAAAARRAARIADAFMPSTQDLVDAYRDELRRLGKPVPPAAPADRPPSIVLVHPDPDRAWDEFGHHLLHDMQTYWRWLRDGRGGTGPYVEVADIDDVRATGYYNIVTPDDCGALAKKYGALDLHPLAGGLPPAAARRSFELIEHEVVPTLVSGDDRSQRP